MDRGPVILAPAGSRRRIGMTDTALTTNHLEHVMTERELWRAMMFYGEFDRHPMCHWDAWPETKARWIAEGMPPDADPYEFFGVKPNWAPVGANMRPDPPFEEKTIEETAEYRIYRDHAGVVTKVWKNRSSAPHLIDFTFRDADQWEMYKERLQPHEGRLDGVDQRIRYAEGTDLPITFQTASMMGWCRNWMGVENMCYLMFDSPDVFADLVDTLSDLACWAMDQIIPRMNVKPLIGFGWEDICGKSGPLVSPDLFDQFVAPGYRKMREKLEEHGVHLLGLDSDGNVEPLAANWLASGVNVLFPIEPGTWGNSPEHMRATFGQELRMIGGFDKLVLEKDKPAIDAEIDRHIPLIEEGGYVMLPDHLITPGTPLENYQHYLQRVRSLRF